MQIDYAKLLNPQTAITNEELGPIASAIIMEWFEKTSAALNGHFVLTSGAHSDTYFDKAIAEAVVMLTACGLPLDGVLAVRFLINAGFTGNFAVVGAPMGAVTMADHIATVARVWCMKDVVAAYAEKAGIEEADLAELKLTISGITDGNTTAALEQLGKLEARLKSKQMSIRGTLANMVEGMQVVVAEDVITKRTSALATIEAVRKAGGDPVAVFCLFNREGTTAEDLGVPMFVPFVNVKANSWPEKGCPLCSKLIESGGRRGTPINTKSGKGKGFLAKLIALGPEGDATARTLRGDYLK